MKKIIAMLGLALFSQQSMAASATVAGIDFIDVANDVIGSTGTFITNYNPGGLDSTIVDSVVDGNGASYIIGSSTPASVDLSFEGALFDVADVDLTILFAGDGPHTGNVTLLGGSLDGSLIGFSITSGENYTGFNSELIKADGTTELWAIFFDTLDLDSTLSGTFADVRLEIGDFSAVPTLVGLTNSVSPVPVPAAVWLFGSGLLGLVGVARRRRS